MNYGAIWSGSWWPTSGGRNLSSAVLSNIGYNGNYWSASPYPSSDPYSAYYLGFYSGNVTPVYTNSRSGGLSVRCVQEEQQNFLNQTKKLFLCKTTPLTL